MADLTLAEIIQLNAGQGHIERAQAEVRPGALPQPPSRDDDGADLGVCRVAGLQVQLRADPSRRQADVTVQTVVNSETYALDVGSSTVTAPSDASAEAHEIIDALFQAVAQAAEPVLPVAEDTDGDGDNDLLRLEGNWTRITVSTAAAETYTVTNRGTDIDYTSSSGTVDDIVSGIAQAIADSSEPLEAKAVDSDADSDVEVLYVAPTSPTPPDLSVSATGTGALSIDAVGDSSDVTIAWNSGSSTGSAELDVAADATSVTFEVWLRSTATGLWDHVNDLKGLQAADNWTENLQSLADYDRGFARITATDGRVTPRWAPALG